MSFLDSIVNGMRFNVDDDEMDDEDELNEDGYEDEDLPPKKKPSFRNRGNKNDVEPEESSDTKLPLAPPSHAQRRTASGMQVRVIKPKSFDNTRQITDTLLSGRTVLLNLEGLDINTAQRIVDFASGSCYALHGNFMQISHYIIVITPENVDIGGDINMEGGDGLGALGALGALSQASGFDNSSNPFTQNLSNPYQQQN